MFCKAIFDLPSDPQEANIRRVGSFEKEPARSLNGLYKFFASTCAFCRGVVEYRKSPLLGRRAQAMGEKG